MFWRHLFQPTLPARGATLKQSLWGFNMKISINAPRTGSDQLWDLTGANRIISTHAPRTGSDAMAANIAAGDFLFQPTLPARGATAAPPAHKPAPRHFNPRSPHGERLEPTAFLRQHLHFNPRSPHGERREVTSLSWLYRRYFNPRSPHGERRASTTAATALRGRFQPTLPARGATGYSAAPSSKRTHFNPRSPHGERRSLDGFHPCAPTISTHAPRTGSDLLIS